MIYHPGEILVAEKSFVCYTSCAFDEKLQEHINHELADDAGCEGDTS